MVIYAIIMQKENGKIFWQIFEWIDLNSDCLQQRQKRVRNWKKLHFFSYIPSTEYIWWALHPSGTSYHQTTSPVNKGGMSLYLLSSFSISHLVEMHQLENNKNIVTILILSINLIHTIGRKSLSCLILNLSYIRFCTVSIDNLSFFLSRFVRFLYKKFQWIFVSLKLGERERERESDRERKRRKEIKE